MITYRTLPGSSTRYQRVNVGECTAWVQTNLEFELEVQHLDQTADTKPYIDTGSGTRDTFHRRIMRRKSRGSFTFHCASIRKSARHQARRRLVAVCQG